MARGREEFGMGQSTEWGRIDDEGTVFVRTADGERPVGSWQAGDPADGLAHFCRRYDDLATEVELLEKRLASGAADPASTRSNATTLKEALPDAAVIGDLDGLSARLEGVIAAADGKLAEVKERRAQAKAAAAAAREKLAAEAEELADSAQWKATGDRFRAIVDEWRLIKGVDRRVDEQLWKRFAAARDTFTKRRGAHFAERDQQRDSVRLVKERIVAEAEELASSKDWGPTASRMRQLLLDWKASGRARREAEDALWSRFRAAQDAFFAARSAVFSEQDAEQVGNQKLKESLIAEAEALNPADLEKSKAALRELQERYDAVGHVPRDAVRGLDARMQEAERRIRDAVEDRWDRSAAVENPVLVQLREAAFKAESQLAKARAAGNPSRVADAEAALEARRQWLAEAERSARP